MKSLFLKSFVFGVVASATAAGMSLYDTAPMVGLPESQVAQYYVSMSGGYDTNPQGTFDKRSRKAGEYVNASLSTTFADMESVDKLSYSARLGGTHYFNGAGSHTKYRCDSGASVSLTHAFSARSQYHADLNVSYMPEPGYDSGISAQGLQGDTLTWNFMNRYSEAIDARWSWNGALSTSGTKYERSTYAHDDRQYINLSLGLNYRESDLMTYTASVSTREELRRQGYDSRSYFANVGLQRSLDMVSSVSATVGAQLKETNGLSRVHPTLELGYRRRVTDGLSVNAYAHYSNENIDNYSRSYESTYRSCPAWRFGAYGTYVLSPDVSYVFRVQYMHTDYKMASQQRMGDSSKQSINPSLSLQYQFTPELQGNITAEYTYYLYERKKEDNQQYTRWKISTGLSYRF